MILDNPGPPKPEREYIRQNRPFTKPPFYLPVIFKEVRGFKGLASIVVL